MKDDMVLKGKQVFLSYEDAQQLKPFFELAKAKSEHKNERESAGRVLQELRLVRDIDYSPLRGKQIILNDMDYDFLRTVMNHYELQ